MSDNDLEKVKKSLFIDIGNSSFKLAEKVNGEWERIEGNYRNGLAIKSWLNYSGKKFDRAVVCSVREDRLKELEETLSDVMFTKISIDTIPKGKLDYQTPKTLGIDRYLGCLGAQTEINDSVVVIDAGTACTIDFMDEHGVYRGGIIAPGLRSMLNIFKENAPQLPEVESKLPEDWPGKSTTTSLQWGQLGFYIDGLEAAIKRFKEKYNASHIYLTGGSAEFLSAFFSFEVCVDNFLVFKGMDVLSAG